MPTSNTGCGDNFTSMKVGLTAHELRPLRGALVSPKTLKIRAFWLGTAILHELYRTVADGAIRESQSHGEYAPYVAATVRR
jgi:hypothetical protein